MPDVSAALKRVEEFGYEIIKPLGDAEEVRMGVSAKIVSGTEGVVDEGYKHVFRQLAFVRDPDVSSSLFSFRRDAWEGKGMGTWLTWLRGIGSSLCRKSSNRNGNSIYAYERY